MGRSRRARWLVVLAAVLLVHALLLIYFMRRQQVSAPAQSSEMQLQVSAQSASSVAETGAPYALKNPAQLSDISPAQTESKRTSEGEQAAHAQTHSSAPSSIAPESEATPRSPAVSSRADSAVGQSLAEGPHGGNAGGGASSSALGSATVTGGAPTGGGQASGATTQVAVNCSATIKPPNANTSVGLDVAVWMERTADGGRFVGLLNQSGEGSRYLREIRSAVERVRFVAHDASCIGKQVKVIVRITA